MTQMTLGEYAEKYEPTKSVDGIENAGAVPLNIPVMEEEKTDKLGNPYKILTVDLNGKKYRIPTSVLVSVKLIQKNCREKNLAPMVGFSVIRSGTTKDDTRYTVVPIQKVQ